MVVPFTDLRDGDAENRVIISIRYNDRSSKLSTKTAIFYIYIYNIYIYIYIHTHTHTHTHTWKGINPGKTLVFRVKTQNTAYIQNRWRVKW